MADITVNEKQSMVSSSETADPVMHKKKEKQKENNSYMHSCLCTCDLDHNSDSNSYHAER